MKRITWFLGGAVACAAGVNAAKRKVRQTAAKLSPARVARSTGERVQDAVRRGGRALRTKERELVARAQGRATSLSDEIDDVHTVIVDGKAVEPGKVIVLRQPAERPKGQRRRGA